jgi:hypothetical protein
MPMKKLTYTPSTLFFAYMSALDYSKTIHTWHASNFFRNSNDQLEKTLQIFNDAIFKKIAPFYEQTNDAIQTKRLNT